MTKENVSPRKRHSPKKRWVGENMCPWKENEVGNKMWFKGEDGFEDNFPWKGWAQVMILPQGQGDPLELGKKIWNDGQIRKKLSLEKLRPC
jgi:hypothetical protein